MLRHNNVIINHTIETAVDALKAIGEVMLNCGSITQNYITNMITSFHELGPYFVIAPGIAIAHARPDESVLHNDFALMVCPHGVSFNSHNDPVFLVFGMCATSAHTHLEGLVTLSEILSDDQVVEQIKASSSIDEILAIVAPFQKGVTS